MKKTVIGIGKTIAYYISFIIILNMVCAIGLRQFYNEESYLEVVISLIYNVPQIDGKGQLFLNIVVAGKSIIEGISLAILASFIFTYILNKDVNIIFPEKIVLRRRTSEGSTGKLTLGILIGNPGKRFLCDVKCSLNCTYLKSVDVIVQQNGETYLNQTIDSIKNYFRFSFLVEDLPKIFWQHYLEKKDEYIDKDILTVTITGKTIGLGGYFRVSKEYSIRDIVIDDHIPEKYFKKVVKKYFSSETKTKIDWKKFPRCLEASEDYRQNIINEIRNYVDAF